MDLTTAELDTGEVSNGGLVIFAGGVLLTDKAVTIAGAVSVSGGTNFIAYLFLRFCGSTTRV